MRSPCSVHTLFMRGDEQLRFRRFPVTVTRLPVTPCQICRRTVACRPGGLSEVLTGHYRPAHPEEPGRALELQGRKCGSCSMEINGRPRLACMTRMSIFEAGEPITITPLRTFPVIRDLVTDLSFNYAKPRQTPSFTPDPSIGLGEFRMQQVDVQRSQGFRKCIECYLCQNVCHVIRDHPENERPFAGPVPDADRRAGDAPGRHRRPARDRTGRLRARLLQHHQVLHRGLPGEHQDHRQTR